MGNYPIVFHRLLLNSIVYKLRTLDLSWDDLKITSIQYIC